ncbi:hypothetical protein V3N99_19455 [Dermatophilaceae bacterium Soc4.6]
MSVSADDVTAAVAAAVDALESAAGSDWSVRAGDLEWDCWETAEHVADDLFYYAAQLGAPGYPDYLPLRAEPNRPGGEPNTIRVLAEAGPACTNADATARVRVMVLAFSGFAAVGLVVWGMLALRWRRPWLLGAGAVAAVPGIWFAANAVLQPSQYCL